MMKTYMFVGGTLESFVKFRLSWLEHILQNEHNSRIINIYFGNADDMALPKLDSERCIWINLQGNHAGPLISDVIPVSKLAFYLTKYSPEYVVCFNAKPILFIGLLKALGICRASTTALLEGLGFGFDFLKSSSLKSKLKTILVKFSTPSINKWIFLNKHDQSLFENKTMIGKKARTMTVNGVGVDLDYYSSTSTVDDNWAKQSVGFSGRLIWQKGPQVVADVARRVKDKLPDVTFHFAGRMTPHPHNINKKTLEEWLESGLITSNKYYDDNRDFYSKQSLVILPTVYDEGLPAVAMEGQALGLPVLLNKLPQTETALEDGLTGYLIPDNDPSQYADIIIRLMSDKEAYKNVAENCRPFAEAQFDRSKVNSVFLDFIESN